MISSFEVRYERAVRLLEQTTYFYNLKDVIELVERLEVEDEKESNDNK